MDRDLWPRRQCVLVRNSWQWPKILSEQKVDKFSWKQSCCTCWCFRYNLNLVMPGKTCHDPAVILISFSTIILSWVSWLEKRCTRSFEYHVIKFFKKFNPPPSEKNKNNIVAWGPNFKWVKLSWIDCQLKTCQKYVFFIKKN